MKISLEWLKDYFPSADDVTKLGDLLTHGGLPVEIFEKHGDDDVFDVEVTSNRSDCLSHLGVARELAALSNQPFKDVIPKSEESSVPTTDMLRVRLDSPLCPHYVARVIRNVQIRPSPPWLQRRLQAVGLRPVNNVVDVTNYVMMELGQPLHAFDFDKVEGRQVIVRCARAGEVLTSLDGHVRKLTDDMLVIADAQKPIALAGVMGGRDSEVSDGTKNVLLESARFDPLTIRRTGRALSMKSDSSYRFERGIDPLMPERASVRAAELIKQIAGGEILAHAVEGGQSGHQAMQLSVRFSALRRTLGVDVPAHEAIGALRRVGFSPVQREDRIDVVVPSHRLDVRLEVDLVEEIARIWGYSRIPLREQIEIRLTPPDPRARAFDTIRDSLVGAGFFEAITYTFVSDTLATDFVVNKNRSLPRVDPNVRRDNAQLRPSLIPGLLEALLRNESAGMSDVKVFETGSIFSYDDAMTLVENRGLALVSGGTDLRAMRGAVEVVLGRLDKERRVSVLSTDRQGYARGTAGEIRWAGEVVGYVGMTDQAIVNKVGLGFAPAMAELDLNALLQGARAVPQLASLPKFPAVRRDLSLIVGDSIRYSQIEATLQGVGVPDLEAIDFVTTYRGKPLEKGLKSITTTLVFRSPATTLRNEDVEASVGRLIEACRQSIGATIRT